MSTTVFPESGDQITEAAWTAQNAALMIADGYRVSGYTLSAGTGLNANVAAGTCMLNGYYINSDASQAVSVTASQTNYIWLNEDGTLSSNTTGTNPGDELLLGTAVTDGSGVTSVSHDYNITNAKNAYIRKASDETVNNSSAYQDDDDFSFAVTDGSQWEVDFFLASTSADASADLKLKMNGSGGATVTQRLFLMSAVSGSGFKSEYSATGVVWDVQTTSQIVAHLKVLMTVSGDGTATLQWAQNSAVSNDTILKAGSVMVARRIAG